MTGRRGSHGTNADCVNEQADARRSRPGRRAAGALRGDRAMRHCDACDRRARRVRRDRPLGVVRSAQTARADSLLNAGALQRAESLYYSAVQARPRDPMARLALGQYLVSRGAPRVGMTLFEEALQFGGDASVVNADLAPTYLALGEYHKLSALKASPLSAPERERARWLVARSTKLMRARLRRDADVPEVERCGPARTRLDSRQRPDSGRNDRGARARDHHRRHVGRGKAASPVQATWRVGDVGGRHSGSRRFDRSRTDQSRRRIRSPCNRSRTSSRR